MLPDGNAKRFLLEEYVNVTIIALGFHPILGAMIGLDDRGNHMKDLLAGVRNSKPFKPMMWDRESSTALSQAP